MQAETETAFLVGVQVRGQQKKMGYSMAESLQELGRLASTAGLQVVGQMQQQMGHADPRTYIGPGKLQELRAAVAEAGADTVIFDDELSPRVARALEKALGEQIRLCDRTALILDIFSQRAATKEGHLQVQLAQAEYQLPRLTRLWSHLERQAGGQSKGMGEKQIEVDKRLLRNQIAALKRGLEEVRRHRASHRQRRFENQMPVVALVGYTNSGKSTLLNRMTGAEILAEDKLFATLDPTTRKLALSAGSEALLTDTVGFIQKLPTQLVAAFRATLEEINEATLILHVVDVSHPNAAAQSAAVMQVLKELGVEDAPMLTVWNKIDACSDAALVSQVASQRTDTCAISAATGEGLDTLRGALEGMLYAQLHHVHCLVPYSQAEVLGEVRRRGSIQQEVFNNEGTLLEAKVPESLAVRLRTMRLGDAEFQAKALAVQPALAGA